MAGESSGDAHAASLSRELRRIDPEIKLAGAGGEAMRRAGVCIGNNLARQGIVGLWEVLEKFQELSRAYRQVLSHIRQFDPDVVILVDFPGFNLKLAEQLQRENIPVIYYISPQVWAWRKGRIRKIKNLVERIIVFFRFEENLYKEHNVPVTWVGHPLVDDISKRNYGEDIRTALGLDGDPLSIGLLPGSREAEFRRHYPRMKETVRKMENKRGIDALLLPVAPEIDHSEIQPFRNEKRPDEYWFHGRSRDVIGASDLILTASGTTTLEAALLRTPMVVCYRVNTLTWAIGLTLVDTDYFALANVVAGEEIVPECLQWEAVPNVMARHALRILENGELQKHRKKLERVRQKLGPPGASKRAAETIFDFLR